MFLPNLKIAHANNVFVVQMAHNFKLCSQLVGALHIHLLDSNQLPCTNVPANVHNAKGTAPNFLHLLVLVPLPK